MFQDDQILFVMVLMYFLVLYLFYLYSSSFCVDVTPVVSTFTKARNSTRGRRMWKMNIIWDLEFSDFTSSVQDVLLKSLSR